MYLSNIFLYVWLLIGLLPFATANAAILSPPDILKNSQQLIVVTAPNWNTVNAQLQRYQRLGNSNTWQSYGKPIAVVIGKHGMAWDDKQLITGNSSEPIKKEGDLRSPAGIFLLGTTFGFAVKPEISLKMPYLSINSNTVCVDDVKSIYYNQIIDTSKVAKNSWKSGENMAQVPGYLWGAVIQYNLFNPIPGAGSCIFMHIWKGAGQGTAGCIAMPEPEVKQILTWLDAKKKPLIVILPQPVYTDLINRWHLPVLN